MTDELKPLTEAELERLEARNNAVGLPTTDVRHLIAEVRRLRNLVRRVEPWMSGLHAEARSQAETQAVRELLEELEREVRR